MKQRIIGFDLARAYAIFGMYIVNFSFCFGNLGDQSLLGKFTSIFIICAGMGVILLAKSNTTLAEKNHIKSVILKRSWFLFFLGIALYSWWPGDILHFYGGYLHIAAFLLFVPKQRYLWLALLFILGYNLLQMLIPITTSWNLRTTQYADFWTPQGFIRNTLYNGWNSIFPWFAYFALGMFLGKLDWHNKKIQQKMFLIGLGIFSVFKALRLYIRADFDNPKYNEFYIKYWPQLMEDYFPANIPYLMITTGFALMVISFCMYLGNRFEDSKIINWLVKTGQMTLSLYVLHITVGVIILAKLSNLNYTGYPISDQPLPAGFVLSFAILFFVLSVAFSVFWTKKFKKGPIESLMRKMSN
jgi:uncharacterized membrane protein YeiB